ncbi:MAG: hypothetical protein J5828_06415 [Desulfovibrionaceae bacterium]|nr:hypothetical protein [Desulfovibrionaceae bacterium]
MQELLQWISSIPGMAWQIELQRSRMSVINDWAHPLLGRDTSRLIKDSRFRKSVIRAEDLPLLAEFQDMMTANLPAAVIFRLREEPDASLLLQGWPVLGNPGIYCGILKYACLPGHYTVGNEPCGFPMSMTLAEHPVLVLDTRARALLACNEAAKQRFCPGPAHAAPPQLASSAPDEYGESLMQAAKKALEDDIWAGTLVFAAKDGQLFSAKVRLSPCGAHKEDGLVRIALLYAPRSKAPDLRLDAAWTDMPQQTSRETLRKGLKRLFDASPIPIDGLMFSDIQSPAGKVEVYGIGRCFEGMDWGAPHAYEGTIAQDIERFGLSSLSVEDTLDSIKSIDWVLFIPQGIRSYFALPFFNARGLHAVLIFACKKPRAFPQNAETLTAPLRAPFERLIAQWRLQEEKKDTP